MSGIPAWAVKGAKVTLVRKLSRGPHIGAVKWLWLQATGSVPAVGSIYTISSVRVGPSMDRSTEYCFLKLRGIPHWHTAHSFRPLVEDSDDNEIEARIFRSKHKANHITKPREMEVS